MPRPQANSELLAEGCRSYHKALFAITQFRREVREAIRGAVRDRIDEIAAALQLDKAELSDGLSSYAAPANFAQSWDGSEAKVGLKYPGRDEQWGVYFYFWIGKSGEGCARAHRWIKEPGAAMQKLAALSPKGLEIEDVRAWTSVPIDEAAGGLTGAMGRALGPWIEAWRKVGGLQQFLPPN